MCHHHHQNDNYNFFKKKTACLGKNKGENTYSISLLVQSIRDTQTYKMDFVLPRSRARAGSGAGFVLGVVTYTWSPKA